MNIDWKAFAKLAMFLVAAFTLTLCLRLAWIVSEQQTQAQSQAEQGNMEQALKHYERAIHAYIPFWPPRSQVIEKMRSHLFTLESNKEKKLALKGWRRMRGAILSTRSMFGQPDRQWLEEANRNIARLAAATDEQGKMPRLEIEREASRLLAESPRDVHAGWGVAQFLFLMLWIVSSMALIWNWQCWRAARRWQCAAISLSAWLSWLAALYMAG